MPRELKHKADTSYYHFDNVNPKGRRTDDCVVRAISKAMNKPWDEVFDALYEIGRVKKAMPNSKEVYSEYLKQQGWIKMPSPKKPDNHRYIGREFVKMEKNCILHIGGLHLSCIIDGKINDTWDCSLGSVGNYWVKG